MDTILKSFKKFYGSDEIEMIEINDRLTQSANENIFNVHFKSGKLKFIPELFLEKFGSDEATELGKLSEDRKEFIASKIIEILLKSDIVAFEIPSLFNVVGSKIDACLDRASNYAWTGDDETWVPGDSFLKYKTLLDAENIIKTIKKKDGQEGQNTEN